LPSQDNAYNLGVLGESDLRWKSAFLRSLDVLASAGDVTIKGTGSVLRLITLGQKGGTYDDHVKIDGALYINNTITLNGANLVAATNISFAGDNNAARTITLGQSSTYTDLISVGGRFSTNLAPNAETETLGTGGLGGKRWYNAYLKGADVLGNATFSGSVSLVAQSTGDKLSLKAHASQASQIFEVADSGNNVRVVIDENFRMGIGANAVNPLVPLEISKSGGWAGYGSAGVAAFVNSYPAGSDADVFVVSGDSGIASLYLGNATVPARAKMSYDSPNSVLGFNLTTTGAIKFNSGQGNVDFSVSGQTLANLLCADASADRIGIGTNAPNAMLDVRGDAIFNEGGEDKDFRIETDGLDAAFFVDGGTNKIHLGLNGAISANNGRVVVHQTVTDAAIPALEIEQLDTDQPFIRFTGGTIYTGKSESNQYVLVSLGGTTGYLRIYVD
jgi:hypothetical protein